MPAILVDAGALKAMLADGQELAIVDLREELIFSQGHLLFARSVPLSRLELKFARLVPQRGTRIVLCDGGVAAWAEAGFELFSGVNVPSKAFGEFIEHASATPSIDAAELERLMRERSDIVVLDSRPFDEYQRVSIPTAVNVPGAELVLRIRDLAPSPQTMVVVNCAGRTRSIIGAQSLINAGVPNKVVALRNGTMGWTLAGFACDSGKSRRAGDVSRAGLAWAKAAGGAAHRLRRPCRAHGAQRSYRRRSLAEPRLPQGAHSRRVVCDPLAAQTRAREDSAAGDAGAHVRGWRARRPRGPRG